MSAGSSRVLDADILELPGGGRALFTGRAHGNLSSVGGEHAEHGLQARERLRESLGVRRLVRGYQVHGTVVGRVHAPGATSSPTSASERNDGLRAGEDSSVREHDNSDLQPNDDSDLQPNDDSDLQPNDDSDLQPNDDSDLQPNDDSDLQPNDDSDLQPNDDSDLQPNDDSDLQPTFKADGHAIAAPGLAAMVLTADCIPVALGADGAVAALHAGWRGLAAGVLEEGVRALREVGGQGEVVALVGPCAGGCCYEVGEEVHAAFGGVHRNGRAIDLRAIAHERLRAAGVADVRDVDACTICDARFFSYRREGASAGRQAGIAWLS